MATYYLTVDSLITLNNIITGSNNLFLRSVNVRPAFYKKKYLDFTIIKFELYKLIDLFNDRYITNREMVELAKYYLKIDFNTLSSIFCQIFVFLLISERIVSDVDCIVNNGNILTDGRWKCYYQFDKRVCWRE